MKRLLLTVKGGRCPFGCSYCFAGFSQYEKPFSLEDLDRHPDMLNGIDVIYPACDIDLFALPDPIGILKRIARYGRTISVSTKARIAPKVAAALGELETLLVARGCFLKVSVSLSTKCSIGEIEPRAANFEERLVNLRLLNDFSVPHSVIIKPILPQIDIAEYFEIIRSVSGYTNFLGVGDLYLDVEDRRSYGGSAGNDITFSKVSWARGIPTWPCIKEPTKMSMMVDFAESLGMKCFFSDLEFMTFLGEMLVSTKGRHELAGAR
jgi:hypothetical protein